MQHKIADRIRALPATVGAAIVLACSTSIAVAAESIPNLPAIRTYGPVTYISGGIDDREILAMRATERRIRWCWNSLHCDETMGVGCLVSSSTFATLTGGLY